MILLLIFLNPPEVFIRGDPLLPFLFIILVECIGRLIEKNKKDGKIKGIKPSSKSDPFSHQQFVDDTIMGGRLQLRRQSLLRTSWISTIEGQVNSLTRKRVLYSLLIPYRIHKEKFLEL